MKVRIIPAGMILSSGAFAGSMVEIPVNHMAILNKNGKHGHDNKP